MAITIDGTSHPWDYMFKSTDTKPTTINDKGDPVPANAIGWEWDTGKWYVFDPVDGWSEAGSNA